MKIDLSGKKRIVIKLGTSTLTHESGLLNIRKIENLVKCLADLQNSGRQLIIVSSGAVGCGLAKLVSPESCSQRSKSRLAPRSDSVSLLTYMTAIFRFTVTKLLRCS